MRNSVNSSCKNWLLTQLQTTAMVNGLTAKKMCPYWHAGENANLMIVSPKFKLIPGTVFMLASFGKNKQKKKKMQTSVIAPQK